MSQDVFDRAIAREDKAWETPQVDTLTAMGQSYSTQPVQAETFMLDKNRIRQDIALVYDAETEALNKLDVMLGIALSKIYSDSLIIAAKIASKRVVMSYEYVLKQKKLDVKTYSNLIASEFMDAKIADLAVDYAEVATLLVKVNLYQQETALKIQELQAEISEQSLKLEEAKVDVAKAQIDVLRAENAIAREIIKALEVQVNILEVLYQVAEVELRKVEIEAESIGIDAAIKRTTIAGYRLTNMQRRYALDTDAIARKLTSDLQSIAYKSTIASTEFAGASTFYSTLVTYMTAENAVQAVRQAIHAIMEDISMENSNMDITISTDVSKDDTRMVTRDIAKLESFSADEDIAELEDELAFKNEIDLALDVAKIKTAAGFASAVQYQLAYGSMTDPGEPTVPSQASTS
jgi:hypothetical protein